MNRILESGIQALKQLREPIVFVPLTVVACFCGYRSIKTLSYVPADFLDLVPFSVTNAATHVEGMLFSFLAGILLVLLASSLIHLMCTESDEYTIWANILFACIDIAFIIVDLYFLVLAIYLLCAILAIGIVAFLWANNSNKR
ncbi:hypothetical protein BK709_15580 [Bacillus thuringiensis serovar shandongiensis]|uniref:hypothetical protein n=1 Tax=Bacillus toyonensis TaxID=155322 RepID=UPI000B445960|nr:hypothetical protein [Bacillus toyonensis]MEC2393869.1 hypothetical protein [Bacillus toyonensis]OTX38083.1 hypothetical protein BK717_09415 [Bacillus thuringiensis serovar malayensis]OUB06007.1 hypothetical protein BK709_15580 [Bacillus thuringiensis serovar shandongiensis]